MSYSDFCILSAFIFIAPHFNVNFATGAALAWMVFGFIAWWRE